MTTIVNTKSRVAKAIELDIKSRQEGNTCFDCVNYRGGACAFRLNSPDYLDYTVEPLTLACDNFNVTATPVQERHAYYHGMETQGTFGNLGLSSVQRDDETHDFRKVISVDVMSVDALHRLGYTDQQYPVLVATIQHGEGQVFFLPNTITKTITIGEGKRRLPSNRYNVAEMAQRVAEKGVVKLENWQHVQFEASPVPEASWKPRVEEDSKARLMRIHYQRQERLAQSSND